MDVNMLSLSLLIGSPIKAPNGLFVFRQLLSNSAIFVHA